MKSRRRLGRLLSAGWLLLVPGICAGSVDRTFDQEYHEPYPIGGEARAHRANDVRAIAVDHASRVWAGTMAGLYVLSPGQRQWRPCLAASDAGPVFALAVDRDNTVWAGAWNGLYRFTHGSLLKVADVQSPVAALAVTPGGLVALGPDGLWRQQGEGWQTEPLACARSIRAALADDRSDRGLWIATHMGLYHLDRKTPMLLQDEDQILSPYVEALAFDGRGRLWAGGLGGVTLFHHGHRCGQFTAANGLPASQVQSVRRAPDGRVWVGTPHGVARYTGTDWSVRHSRRWLVDDDVRDMAFDDTGTAWIATVGGVSALKRRSLTLAQKADHYLRACYQRHIREPGLVEKCRLQVPGDLSSWVPRDDDNDGQYTAMYLAMESFRYAVTHDPEARQHAHRAFEALRFLQTVTDTPGFFARTVIPSAWTNMADPNRAYTPQEWAAERLDDPRHKRVEQRWRRSRDGQWLWKGDTSSDETTGHFYGYFYYYELAADESAKTEVRAQVRRITDAILAGGYALRDLDDLPTRWAVWNPEKLNGDPDWAAERGINSLELLSFLKVAHHLTGDDRYQREYLRLIRDHHYAQNARRAKNTNPSFRTHIDDELLALAYPGLILGERDPGLRALYRDSLEHWHRSVAADAYPLFDFTYLALHGAHGPLEAIRRQALAFFQDTPLDLVRWTIDNSWRLDLKLVRVPELEHLQTNRLLPPSERGTFRSDENPFLAVQGDGGHTESDGIFWLLPYWMGRYYGFVPAPEN